jgi:hypothetical protein
VARASAGVGCSTGVAWGDVEETYGSQIALLEPPMSQTKGRGTRRSGNRSASGVERSSTSTYKRKRTEGGLEIIGERSCGTCGVKGHYTTTCPRNPNRSRAVERKGMNRGTKGKRGRSKTKRCNSKESNDDPFEDVPFAEDDDYNVDEYGGGACHMFCWYKFMDVFFVVWTPCTMKLINDVFVDINSASLLNLFCWYRAF